MTVEVNYLAVIIAAVVAIILGFLWYGPIFGKKWMKELGLTKESMDGKKVNMSKTYAIMVVSTLVMAYVFYHVLTFAMEYTGTTGITGGITAAAWNWLGFIAPVTLGSVLWEGKSWKYWFITAGYYLVSLILMGIVLASWM